MQRIEDKKNSYELLQIIKCLKGLLCFIIYMLSKSLRLYSAGLFCTIPYGYARMARFYWKTGSRRNSIMLRGSALQRFDG